MLPNQLSAVFVYSLETKKATQITDGMSDALFPAFDKSGKYLYFTASTDIGPRSWLDMSGINRPVSRTAYVVVLRKDLPSPLAPESDEEKTAAEKKAEKDEDKGQDDSTSGAADDAQSGKGSARDGKADPGRQAKQKQAEDAKKADDTEEKKPPRVDIDFDGITQRMLALPIPARTTSAWWRQGGASSTCVQAPRVLPLDGPTPLDVKRFDLKTRKLEDSLSGADDVTIAADGEKMLYKKKDEWFIQGTESAVKAGEGALKLDDGGVRGPAGRVAADVPRGLADPARLPLRPQVPRPRPGRGREEVRGVPRWPRQPRRSELPVPGDARRAVARPRLRRRRRHGSEPPKVKGGLLGADYKRRERPLPLRARLQRRELEPRAARAAHAARRQREGGRVPAGGQRPRPAPARQASTRRSRARPDKSVIIRVGPNPDGTGAREVTVVPVEDETGCATSPGSRATAARSTS